MIPWMLIARVAVVLAIVGAIWYAKYSYDENRRDEGRTEVQEKWDADTKRRNEAAALLASKWNSERLAAEQAQEQLRQERAERQRMAAQRVRSLPPSVSALPVPDIGRLLDDILRGNDDKASGIAKQPEPDSAPVTVGRWAEWSATVIDYYEACRDQVKGLISFYDSLRKQQTPEGE